MILKMAIHVYMINMLFEWCKKQFSTSLPGFEPGIFWSVVRRVIHCATDPLIDRNAYVFAINLSCSKLYHFSLLGPLLKGSLTHLIMFWKQSPNFIFSYVLEAGFKQKSFIINLISEKCNKHMLRAYSCILTVYNLERVWYWQFIVKFTTVVVMLCNQDIQIVISIFLKTSVS